MNKLYFFIFSFIILKAEAQTLFNLFPKIEGGLNNQCVFYQAHADSFGIMVLAIQPGYINNDSSRIVDIPFLLRYDYDGNLLIQKYLRLPKPIPIFYTFNFPFIVKNDSMVLYYTDIGYLDSAGYQTNLILEINTRTCELIKFTELRLTFNPDHRILPRTGVLAENGNLILTAYATTYKRATPQLQVINLDSSFNIIKNDTIYNNEYVLLTAFVGMNKNKEIEIVGTAADKRTLTTNKRFPHKPFYLKLDDKHEILKLIIRHDEEFVGLPNIRDYSLIQELDQSWVIEMGKEIFDSTGHSFELPYFYKFSPEFDSLIWKTNFYDGRYPDYDTTYNLRSAAKCIDGSGYIAVGTKFRRQIDIPDLGIAIKVAPNGDSLWLRKYQIIGFDQAEPNFCDFFPITASPYNTYIMSGYYTDAAKQGFYPWLLQMDTHGCIIPGCQLSSKTNDHSFQNDKTIVVYPNPVKQHKVYLMSKIDNKNIRITLLDKTGRSIKQRQLDFISGVQYILELPSNLNSDIYYLNFVGPDIDYTEQLIIKD